MSGEAIVLAGGLGTRLAPLVNDRPKSMAGVCGKPFLEYLLSYLEGQEVTRVILAVGYMSEAIRQYFGNHFRTLQLVYAHEQVPLGTGGAILNALCKVQSDKVFILNGDTYFPVPLLKMDSFFNVHNPDLVIALRKVDDASRYGLVLMNEGQKIIKFEEKNSAGKPGLINGGIYLMRTNCLIDLGLPEKFSFETDFLKKYAGEKAFTGIEFRNYFVDIGIPETYHQIRNDFPHQKG